MHYRTPRKARETRVKNAFNEIMTEKNPKPEEGDRHAVTGSTENPRQDEPKQTHTKT